MALCFALSACGSSTATGPKGAHGSGDERPKPRGGAPGDTSDSPPEARPATCDSRCVELIGQAAELLIKARTEASAPGAASRYDLAGQAYYRAWRGCRLIVPDGPDRSCAGADEVIPRLIEAYEEAKFDEELVRAYLIALDPRWRDDAAVPVAKAERGLRQLAERFEQAARDQPSEPKAAKLLSLATYARLALDELPVAAADAQQYRRRYSRWAGEQLPLVSVALAAAYGDAGQWPQALAALSPQAAPHHDSKVRTRVLWGSERGRVLTELGHHHEAQRHFAEVVDLWRTVPRENTPKIIGPPQPVPMLGRERVIDSVGRAMFALAEQKASKVSAAGMPPYHGRATVKLVNEYVNTKVADWIREKEQQIAEAAEAYRETSAITPVPPPSWVVAAESQVGQLWADFADDFNSAAVPKPVTADPELSAAWQRATKEMQRSLHQRARGAFEACHTVARHHGIANDHAARCERWLKEHSNPH